MKVINMILMIFIVLIVSGCFFEDHTPTRVNEIYEPTDNITIPQNKRYI